MGISFLTPLLLAGAAAVAVPVVLHLVMRRKPVPHDFPALRFLQERAVSNRRRLRLNHLLLLLLRMAAVALVALALARPVLRGAGWLADSEAPVAAAFVFDTAPRMLLREVNETRLTRATAMARLLLAKLPAGSSIAVVDTTGGPVAFAPSPAAVDVRLGRLAAGTPQQSLQAAVTAALRLLQESPLQRRELYLFTDCSYGAWAGGGLTELEARHPDTSLLVVDVAAERPQNFAIESLTLSAEQVPAGTPVGIAASLSRTGPDAVRAVAVELLMPDGRYARRAVKPVTWKAGTPLDVDFDLAGLEPGTRQGQLVIDGSDDLEVDNVASFTVAVGAAARVIIAAPAPAARTGLFVTQAVAPQSLTRAGRARFEPEVIDVAALAAADFTPAVWGDARGLVLVDPPPLPPQTWERLTEWVAGGRGLVVWLGPRAGAAEAFNCGPVEKLLGGRLVRVWRSPAGENFLAPEALDHPLLAAFRRVGDAVPWQDFPVLRHWQIDPTEGLPADAGAAAGPAAEQATPPSASGQSATVVARYRNGLPAVLEHRVAAGTVVIVTTPPSQAADDPDAWNTLATGFEPWPFVILANETLLHAIDSAADRNITAGRPAVVQIDRRDLPAAFVRTPAGDEFPAVVDQRRGSITVTATQEPGNYSIRAGGQVAGIATGFSANLARPAVDFTRVPAAELAEVLGARSRLARTEEQLVRDVNLERIGAELYGWIILLAAAAMAADWFVANRFYAAREAPAASVVTGDDAAGGRDSSAASSTPPPVPPLQAPAVPSAVPPPLPQEAGT
jgi:nitroreductase